MVPENYDRVTADYIAEVPMFGFGAAAYITTIAARGAVPPVVPEPDGEPGTPAASTGCGCSSGALPDASLLVGAAVLISCGVGRRGASRRRR